MRENAGERTPSGPEANGVKARQVIKKSQLTDVVLIEMVSPLEDGHIQHLNGGVQAGRNHRFDRV